MEQITPPHKNFVFVNIDFSSYSGQVTPDKELTNPGLDPEVISAGEIKTVPRDALRVFNTLRARARKACLTHGTGFMGGYAIPVNQWDRVRDELSVIMKDFIKEADAFISGYEKAVKDWTELHPESREVIMTYAHSKDWVSGRFHADFSAVFLQPAPGMEEALQNQIKGMLFNICNELATDARQAIKSHMHKGSNITRRIISTFNGMIEKIESLSFIDNRLQPISVAIQEYLDGINLPKTGIFDATQQSRIAMILQIMSTPENLMDLANLLAEEQKKIDSVLQKSQPQMSAPQSTSQPMSTPVDVNVEVDTQSDDSFFLI